MPPKPDALLNRLRTLSAVYPGQTFTRAEIAKHCHVTPGAIRKIELRAIAKLKRRLTPAHAAAY